MKMNSGKLIDGKRIRAWLYENPEPIFWEKFWRYYNQVYNYIPDREIIYFYLKHLFHFDWDYPLHDYYLRQLHRDLNYIVQEDPKSKNFRFYRTAFRGVRK